MISALLSPKTFNNAFSCAITLRLLKSRATKSFVIAYIDLYVCAFLTTSSMSSPTANIRLKSGAGEGRVAFLID